MNRPTTETDVLVLNPGQYTVSLALRNGSALASCTHVDTADDGRLLVVRNWPQLSSGEEALWECLQYLNGQASRPDVADLEARLDGSNYVAALRAVNS